MKAGDLAAFPAGTGISHCFINNGTREALLLVGGDAWRPGNRRGVIPLRSTVN